VAVVDAEEMKKVSNSNISTMLEGKVAGVQITSDGQPGADPSVRIRGISTFGDSNPLYVIDGVPMGTSIRDFSPNDIATIQVLKDASAAAIYGSRAANGVVIITTKNGKKNQPLKVDYSGYFGVDWVNKNTFDVMETDQFVQYIQKAAENANYVLPSGYDPNSENYFLKGDNYVNTDWFDEVFKLGKRQNHNVSLSGGSDHSTYNIGLDYFDQKGVVEGTGPNYTRYTARINNTMDVKFIKFRTGIVYSHSDQNNMSIGNGNEYIQGLNANQGNFMSSILVMQPTILAYDESTWVLDGRQGEGAASALPYDAYGYGVYNANIHGDIAQSNPLVLNNIIERKYQVDRIVGTASATVDLFDMLGIKFENHKLNYNLNLSYSKTYCKDFVWLPTWYQSSKLTHAQADSRLDQGYRQMTDALIENTISYEGTLAEKHHINAVIGQTYEAEKYHTVAAWGFGYNAPYYLQISQGTERDATSYESEHRLASYIGRLNYDFDQKYLLSITARRDGSSRLSSEDRWEWFPSVSLGWRVDRESFFPFDDRLVNLFKIRGSYGILGNENIGEYQYMETMNRNNFMYSFGGNIVSGSAISSFVNTSIAWEKKKSTSVGFDLGMFDGALEFTFEWFKNQSEDLLYGVAVPITAGVTNGSVTMNAAEMENSGFEWSANYHNYKHKVKYDISLNASTLKNKVVSLGFGNDYYLTGNYMTKVGDEIGRFYGWRYAGLIKSQEQLDQWNKYAQEHEGVNEYQPGAKVGDCLYEDLNNDGQITDADREDLGSGMPSLNFGIGGRIEYKGWDLSISTYGALGFKVQDAIYDQMTSCYGPGNKDPEVLGDNYPNVYYTNNASMAWNDLFSERKIQKANYWKIANVELGYNFKNEWFHGIVSNVRAYISAQNIATLTKYKGYNVDYAPGLWTPGFNYCSFPTPKTVMFGLKCTF
jgi:TonB-linked SusC/RagA family outer membrane protein